MTLLPSSDDLTARHLLTFITARPALRAQMVALIGTIKTARVARDRAVMDLGESAMLHGTVQPGALATARAARDAFNRAEQELVAAITTTGNTLVERGVPWPAVVNDVFGALLLDEKEGRLTA